MNGKNCLSLGDASFTLLGLTEPLFFRLKKNGIINVQNPVETAVQEGRFEELSDSDNEKLD